MKDNKFPMTVEDENTTGGSSKLLLHTELEKLQESTGTANFRKVKSNQPKETIGIQSTAHCCEGQVFPGKRYDVNESLNLKLKEKDGTHYQQESRYEASSYFVGLSSSTYLKQYPHDAGIVVHVRDMCGLQKPKLIGNTEYNSGPGVIVYHAIQLDNSSLRPAVMCFSINMERDVPKELVKFSREE